MKNKKVLFELASYPNLSSEEDRRKFISNYRLQVKQDLNEGIFWYDILTIEIPLKEKFNLEEEEINFFIKKFLEKHMNLFNLKIRGPIDYSQFVQIF